MNGNLLINSSATGPFVNKVINCGNPTSAQDVATKTYVDSSITALSAGISNITANLAFGAGTTNPITKTMIISGSFTIANTLVQLIVMPYSIVTTDRFNVSYSNPTFTNGSFSFSATVTRVDVNGAWSQLLQIQATLLYK